MKKLRVIKWKFLRIFSPQYFCIYRNIEKAIETDDLAFFKEYVKIANVDVNVVSAIRLPCGGEACGSDYIITQYEAVNMTLLDRALSQETREFLKKHGALSYKELMNNKSLM